MDNDDHMLEVLERRFGEGAAASRLRSLSLDDAVAKEGAGTGAAAEQLYEYEAALEEARRAAAKLETARRSRRRHTRALSRLPLPWVRPTLHIALVLSVVGLAAAHAGLWQEPAAPERWLPVALGLHARWAGETAGVFVRRAIYARTLAGRGVHVMAVLGVAAMACLTLSAAVALPADTVAGWPVAGMALAAVASAATLPWLGVGEARYAELRRKADASLAAEARVEREARHTARTLARIHERNLQAVEGGARKQAR